MRRLIIAALATLPLLVQTGAAAAADTQALDRALDRARARAKAPGVTAAVMQDGRVVWSGASGLAVQPAAEPMRPGGGRPTTSVQVTDATLMSVASLTKSYTATVVLKLVEQGRLRLDDRVARFLPHVPAARRVTVRQLLGHTAGYPDVEYDPAITRFTQRRDTYDPTIPWTREQMVGMTRAPAFTPGSRFHYSNTNYLLLGSIAERAGGAPLAALLDRFVARPLRARDTLLTRTGLPLDRVAHGYYRLGRQLLLDTWSGHRAAPSHIFGATWPAGGISATAIDAARFSDALQRGRLLRPATLRAMTRVRSRATPYGLGLERYGFAGGTWYGHSGGDGGYTSLTLTDPRAGVTIAVMSNQFELDAAGVTPSPGSSAGDVWLALLDAYRRG
ncbi:serine hydrolase domain-containing protein [Conexibacter woesei]|uniref:Beta-lactamase n=1 Tax=Conexibacter woesei (strain DSM 14684 / CCUG 47730 / CIP 108061 / JCM 11494 / NBRC 100937 / ID131577) TaxID=469383 RepID=D3F369_CONWI|nr:serine hydrolase domain-containing protein [Conexibacter woesei]ADB50349.1 beta-lactamase [Conexibacter woesei DSM 14684]